MLALLRRTLPLLALLLAACPLRAAGPPAIWPQWRGPTRDGQVDGPDWPDTLQGKALQPVWRVELGEGYPGPVVAADRVFVVETRDKQSEVVRALDRRTGKELWKVTWEGSLSVPFFAKRNGDWVRSTPAFDGECLYVAGMRDVLVCLDAATGKQRWRVDFVERYKTPPPAFGCVCSPLVVGEYVYMQAGASFVKLERKTGATVWRTLEDGGGMYGSAFSSPYLTKLRGQEQILVQTRSRLTGVNPADGKVLWSQDIQATRGMNILTPTVWDDGVFTSAHGGKTQFFAIGKEGDAFAVKEAWSTKDQAYMCSPVVVDGHAYLLKRGRDDKRQPLICVDLKTGETKWTSTKDFGEYCSLVAHKDKILALDQRGTLTLLRATPAKFDLLDERKVSEQETWGHLAVCGDEVFVRELNALAVYRWKKGD